MQLFVFARFHAIEGKEVELEATLLAEISQTCIEPGCDDIRVYRSTRDARLYFIHARWADDETFQVHARLPHVRRFAEHVATLIEHSIDVQATRAVT